jgi:translation initiation factor 2 subunit 1
MYEQKFPDADEVVQVQVKRVMDMGAYVSLLEYGNIEGMIMLSELSKRRIRSIKNLIRAGQVMAVAVIRTDENKGYVDLSRRRVSPEEGQKMDEKYAKSKLVHSVMRHTSQQHNIPLEEMCAMASWKLYKKYPHASEAFTILASSDPSEVTEYLSDVPPDVMTSLIANVKRRLTTQACRLRAKVEVSCFEFAGIDAIRSSLLKGLEASTQDVPLSITLVAPPQYAISTTCIDRVVGTKVIETALQNIETAIKGRDGQFVLKERISLVGDDESKIPDRLAEEEAAGSSSSESEEDETMGNLDEKEIEELKRKTAHLDIEE